MGMWSVSSVEERWVGLERTVTCPGDTPALHPGVSMVPHLPSHSPEWQVSSWHPLLNPLLLSSCHLIYSPLLLPSPTSLLPSPTLYSVLLSLCKSFPSLSPTSQLHVSPLHSLPLLSYHIVLSVSFLSYYPLPTWVDFQPLQLCLCQGWTEYKSSVYIHRLNKADCAGKKLSLSLSQ